MLESTLSRGERASLSPALAALIVESALDVAIITLDLEGRIDSWNAGAENILAWPAADAIGMAFEAIFTPEDRQVDAPAHEMEHARESGRASDERWHLRADGTRFWASGLLMPLRRDPETEPEGFVKILRDRTRERENERRFGTLTSALPGFVWVADADGAKTDTNEQFQTYTGRSPGELNGDRWFEVLHPDDRDETIKAWREAIATGAPFISRHRFRDHEGNYRCFDCRAMSERDEHGRVLRWLGICLDVENEHRAHRALERLNQSLQHQATQSTADLATAIEELQVEIATRRRAEDAMRQSQKMEAIGQLTGGVAHDFNNLLTVIRSSADLLRRPGLPEARKARYLDAIIETADRAAALTSQLLAFARRQPLQPAVFDVAEQLHRGAAILRTSVGSHVELIIDIQCSPCPAYADVHQFDTAILNLVVNARDAMSGQGKVEIQVSEVSEIPSRRDHAAQAGEFIRIAVSDAGAGIAPEVLPHIFEPFYTTKPVGAGTGLGLSQVVGFAKQSGGDVAVESPPGRGTTVSLFLPKSEGLPAASASQSAHPDVQEVPAGGCVLVVEDNQAVGEFAAQLLQDLGYHTRWVKSAREALERIGGTPDAFDIVFSDVVMPGISGLELAGEIRRSYPTLPVVLTSGYSHVLAQEGSHGFELLKKPYSAEALSHILNKVRRR